MPLLIIMMKNEIKILMADDDPEDLGLIEEHLISIDPKINLLKFMDGLSAYDYLCSQPDQDLPSLIVLDYNMPGLSGYELLVALKSTDRYAWIQKIVLSSSNTQKFIQECLRNGAAEYIVKPSNMEDLHTLAKRLLSLAEQADQTAGK